MELIDKDKVVAEIEERIQELRPTDTHKMQVGGMDRDVLMWLNALTWVKDFLDTLEVIDPYEQRVQYDSIKAGIQAHAETYSFNIESKLFNQLTKEQQELWRKEIEQACISGGEVGVELARDPRYRENLEVKEVDLEKELNDFIKQQKAWIKDNRAVEYYNGDSFNHIYDLEELARHFFELGMQQSKNHNNNEE